MRFLHTQDQLDLRDGASEFLKGRCSIEGLRELREQQRADLGLWPELAELGLLGYLASKDSGGLGLDAVGFSLIAEQAGYVALPEPLVDVAGVCVPVLNALGMNALLEEITSGASRVLSLHEANPYVNQLLPQDLLLVMSNEQIRLLKVSDCQVNEIESIDPLRRLNRVKFDAHAGEVLASGEQAAALSRLAFHSGAIYSAAELLGLTAAVIDMATEYAKERHQFGKPIGSYQAIKHHLATALVALEFARPTVYRASADLVYCYEKIDISVAHARLASVDAAVQAAETAIQVHGGMGYTFEVDLHIWMKRIWALSGLWGDRSLHMNQIDSALFRDELEIGPSVTF